MPKKTAATVQRTAKSGKFVVRKEDGDTSVHESAKETPKVVSNSIAKNREALRRLADR